MTKNNRVVLKTFEELSQESFNNRIKEAKDEKLFETMSEEEVLRCVTLAVVGDVYNNEIRPIKYHKYGVKPGDTFTREGKTFTIVEVLMPMENDVVLVYVGLDEDGKRKYYCENVEIVDQRETKSEE